MTANLSSQPDDNPHASESEEAKYQLREILGHPLRVLLLLRLEHEDATPKQLQASLEGDFSIDGLLLHLELLRMGGFVGIAGPHPNAPNEHSLYRANPGVFLDPIFKGPIAAVRPAENGTLRHWIEVVVDEEAQGLILETLAAAQVQILAVAEQAIGRMGAGAMPRRLLVGAVALDGEPKEQTP